MKNCFLMKLQVKPFFFLWNESKSRFDIFKICWNFVGISFKNEEKQAICNKKIIIIILKEINKDTFCVIHLFSGKELYIWIFILYYIEIIKKL